MQTTQVQFFDLAVATDPPQQKPEVIYIDDVAT